MEYNTDHFLSMLAKMNISLSDKQLQQFMNYYEMLIEKNKVMNLTAITDFDEVVEKHFVDSVSLIQVVDLHHPLKVIDLGTGAGFPGIPLKIVFPELNVVLADSLNKRLVFLNEVIEKDEIDRWLHKELAKNIVNGKQITQNIIPNLSFFPRTANLFFQTYSLKIKK